MATQKDYYAIAANGRAIPTRSTRDIPYIDNVDTDNSEETETQVMPARSGGWLSPLVITMCVCLVIPLLWQVFVVPTWIHYQERLACGSGHVCKAWVNVVPGKQRLFLALVMGGRITVIELPEGGSDSHVYLGPTLSDYWQDITIQIRSLAHGNYDDVLLDAPEFESADPVLYNHHGSYSWSS